MLSDDSRDRSESLIGKFNVDAVAGALTGGVVRFIIAPLDFIKIRFQLQGKINIGQEVILSRYEYKSLLHSFITVYRKEGVLAFWHGNLLGELLYISFMGIQFGVYENGKRAFFSFFKDSPSSFIIGAIAGLTAITFTYPLDLLRTRFVAQSLPPVYFSIKQAANTIYSKEGLRGFYSGWTPTIVALVPSTALQFTLYEIFKANLHKNFNEFDDSLVYATSGALAGVISKVIFMPLDSLKKRLQVQGLLSDQKNSIAGTAISMYKNGGIVSFYRGVLPSTLKAMLSTSLTFTIYEKFKGLLGNYSHKY